MAVRRPSAWLLEKPGPIDTIKKMDYDIFKGQTDMKKILVLFFLPLWLASLASSQSLAELAKKEKARRERLKGKKVVLVTNADLGKGTKKPAVSSPDTQETSHPSTPGASEAAVQSPPSRDIPPVIPPDRGAISDREYEARKAQLEGALKRADEMVDLLTTKLNGLWQEFYSLNDMTTKDKIQIQISDFYEKLVAAQEEADRARQELESFLTTTKRQGTPQIWIK